MLQAWQRISGSSPFVDSHFSDAHFSDARFFDSNSTIWSGDSVQYNVGDEVTYNGTLYKCLQAHTSLPNWDPVDAASLGNAYLEVQHITRGKKTIQRSSLQYSAIDLAILTRTITFAAH